MRLAAPAWCPCWFAWATVTLVCSLFYITAATLTGAVAVVAVAPAGYTALRQAAIAAIVILGVLGVLPHRPWPAVHRHLGSLWFDIFEVRSDLPELTEGERYLFVIAPHAVFPFWSWAYASFLHWAYPHLGAVGGGVATILLRVPLMRQLCCWTGCIPADYKHLKRGLATQSQQLAVEGIAGIFEAERNFRSDVQVLQLSSRKGFSKLALQTGAHIVPVYCFGNSDAFALAKLPSVLAWVSRRLRMSLTLFHGWRGTTVPYPVRLTFAHGEVLRIDKQTDAPTQGEIDALHARVIDSFRGAFANGKEPAGYAAQRLVVQ